MRSNYWSLGKTATWLRKLGGVPPMPASGTSKEWSDYHKAAKKAAPFVNWLADDCLDGIQKFVCWPKDKLYSFGYYVSNRFVAQTHMLNTGLKPGYHEVDQRLLHGMFETLVRFVEEEKAWMAYIWHSEKYERDLPFYHTMQPFNYFFRFIYPEMGKTYLHWEASLVKDDEWFGYKWRDDIEVAAKERAENTEYGKPTHQAEHAIEILALYHWWKNVRPLRKDPHDESGWSDHCEKARAKNDGDFWLGLSNDNDTEEERDEVRKILDLSSEIEKAHDDEDTEMMVRLVKIRQGLWT